MNQKLSGPNNTIRTGKVDVLSVLYTRSSHKKVRSIVGSTTSLHCQITIER
ncbi:hypothetical protein ABE926_02030 [Enterococcus lactis]|uniref:hypothetical protein n=1 Tax=Enterococcus lactis TaxID=357441 RepID=UPI00377046BE